MKTEEGPSQAKRAKRSKAAKNTTVLSDDDEAPIGQRAAGRAAAANIDDADRLAEWTSHYAAAAMSESQGTSLSAREEDQLVRSVMRYMLFRQMQKPGVPVKRDELNKLIPNSYKSQRIHNLGKAVVLQAQAKFPQIFGMEMKEISTSGDNGPKVYVLRSLLEASLRDLLGSKESTQLQAFTMTVLGLILLAGGKVSEEDLTMHLEKIGVNKDAVHPSLGKLSDMLQSLVQKKYLTEIRMTGSDGHYKMYTVGQLAMDEIDEENMKAFVDSVFKGSSVQWQE